MTQETGGFFDNLGDTVTGLIGSYGNALITREFGEVNQRYASNEAYKEAAPAESGAAAREPQGSVSGNIPLLPLLIAGGIAFVVAKGL